MDNSADQNAYIVTGPISGIGRITTLELAEHGTVVPVGRDAKKLDEVQKTIEKNGQRAASAVYDLSDVARARRGRGDRHPRAFDCRPAQYAGIFQMRARTNTQGSDMSFATNHLGPFALTEALMPHLRDGANAVFVAFGVEDPQRKPARLSRRPLHLSRGERTRRVDTRRLRAASRPGTYATSKQCALATAIESGRTHGCKSMRLSRASRTLDSSGKPTLFLRFLTKYILPLFAPFIKYWSTPKRA
jgi:NAD(P)-dependent dehydrogenase (short-subunit alcohol dehydrogenase family)